MADDHGSDVPRSPFVSSLSSLFQPGVPIGVGRAEGTRPHTAVDIPSPANAPRYGESADVSPADGGAHEGFFVGSATYGSSPGHGLGHLMRPRRRIARRQSRELSHLHSHNELGELAAEADAVDAQPPPPPPIGESPGSPSPLHWTYSFGHDELAAPLLPRAKGDASAAGAAASAHATGQQLTKAVVFGAINATAGIPALVAYAAIVFKHPVYEPYLDLLCKLFFLSSAVHQAVFCLMSALPFAMGQVQDVGIIFLSAMGSSVAALCLEAGRDAATAMGTALVAMTASTFLVGLGTLVVARRHLAVFVQYIPLPVMGGYLGFVGYFCAASGVGLGASVEVDTLLSWGRLLGAAPLAKLAPTLASTALMIATLARFEHPLALPSVLVALVAAFHVALALAGVSLAQAAAAGWVLKPAAGAVKFWELWGLYNFRDWSLRGLYLPAVWRQGAKAAGLLLVVVFGSCMDIAAIAQESPAPLDFDRELLTVGASNVAVGLAGVGFTGSYIFSQTIFTMRAGVRSRVNGWVIAGAELAVFLIPYSVVQFLPNYFLGALLLWFGVEISRDWLVLSFYRLTGVEYALLWVTFGSIMQWGLEGGVAAGIVSATLYFAVAYARSQVSSFAAAAARSTVVRTVEQQAALDLFWPTHAATARLQGFIFFGSAQSIGVKVEEAGRALAEAGAGSRAEREEHREAAIEHSMRSMGEDYAGGGKHDQAVAALDAAPKFMVLDFAKVTGLDSSGARTLAAAVRELAALGVAPVLTGAGHHGVAALLAAHDVRLRSTRWPPELRPAEGEEAALGGGGGGGGALAAAALEEGGGAGGAGEVEGEGEPEVLLFPTLEEGLRFCEDALLEVAVRHGLCAPPSQGLTLEALLAVHLDKLPLTSPANAPAMAAILRRYMQRRTARRGEVLWSVDDDADSLFVVEKGTLRVDQYRPASEAEDAAALAAAREAAAGAAGGAVPWAEAEVRGGAGPGGRAVRVRSFELGPGCVAGTTDFYLARPHGTQAVCATHACRVLWLSRHAMQRMAAEAPAALNVLQLVVMRANSSDLSAAADAAARVQ